MEEELNLTAFTSNHAVIGAIAGGAIAFIYKIFKILKSDYKENDLDNAERSFREELKEELRSLKNENTQLKIKNEELFSEIIELKSAIKYCSIGKNCPNHKD